MFTDVQRQVYYQCQDFLRNGREKTIVDMVADAVFDSCANAAEGAMGTALGFGLGVVSGFPLDVTQSLVDNMKDIHDTLHPKKE